MFVLSTDSPLT